MKAKLHYRWIAATTFLLTVHSSSIASTPYFLFNAITGNQNPIQAQIWWPSWQQNNNYLFIDLDGSYSVKSYNGNVNTGLIYRRLINNHYAVGGYTYVDYNRSTLGQNFYGINPGIEFINRHWHINWDGYFNLNARYQSGNQWQWADNAGLYQYIRFEQHKQYNQLVRKSSIAGPGTDLIVSYRFSQLANIQASLGAYYFSMPGNPVGAVAKLSTPIKHHLSFSMAISHDPLTSNSINFGISFHFGNDNSPDTDWMMQPVQHNLTLNSNANSIPIKTGYQNNGQELLQKDNVWFFSPAGSSFDPSTLYQNCTAESPCADLNQTNLERIGILSEFGSANNNPDIYIASGNYTTSNPLTLYINESLIGRNSDFTQPALGNDRPLITTPAIAASGGTNKNITNTLANFRLLNSGANFAAIEAAGTQSFTLDNVQVGTNNSSTNSQNYNEGLDFDDVDTVTINNSTVDVNNKLSGTNSDALDLVVQNVNALNINNSTLNSEYTGSTGGLAGGIIFKSAGSATINNSTLNQQSNDTISNTINIDTFNNNAYNVNLTINNSQFTATSTNSDNGSAINIVSNANSVSTITNSTFNATISSTNTNQASQNIQLANNAKMTITNSAINGQGSSVNGESSATNIYLFDNSQITINSSTLNATGNSATVTGSTNITAGSTAGDTPMITINDSTLNTSMAGGPSTGEPSGAVPIWLLFGSKATVNNSTITASALNNETGVVPIQTQGNSQITINNSTLIGKQLHGNITGDASSVLTAANNSQITTNNSILKITASGNSNSDILIVSALNNARITLNNNKLIAQNDSTAINGANIRTIGIASGSTTPPGSTAIVYSNGNSFNLTGNNVVQSETFGNGQVIFEP